jgi:hypothetical protein
VEGTLVDGDAEAGALGDGDVRVEDGDLLSDLSRYLSGPIR